MNLILISFLTFLATLLFSSWHEYAVAGTEVTFTADVPPRTWKTVRLKNLPSRAKVAVEIETNGEVSVALVNQGDFARFPEVTRSVFSGKVEKRLSFTVTIPATGDYFLIFNNRQRDESRAITVTVKASRGNLGSSQLLSDGLIAAEKKLQELEHQINEVFIFDPFPIRVKQCGVATAFAGEDGIVLCAEYVDKVYQTLKDKEKTSDAMLFTLFHELGHVLLEQWQYPFSESEEVADEFATAFMVMLGQKTRVRAKAEFFASNPSVAEAIGKSFRDDRHPLSVQRARNILRWLEDPKLVHNWQTVFVPHMQTRLLERLRKKPTSWTNLALVKKELARRQ